MGHVLFAAGATYSDWIASMSEVYRKGKSLRDWPTLEGLAKQLAWFSNSAARQVLGSTGRSKAREFVPWEWEPTLVSCRVIAMMSRRIGLGFV